MTRLIRFLRKSRADRRMLIHAAVLHAAVAVLVRVCAFGRVRHVLDRVAAIGPRLRDLEDVEARVARAVRTVSSLIPGEHCLADALVAQCLLARSGRETTLCFGVARNRSADGRPFDAHAWLERHGAIVVGARDVRYAPLHPAHSRCGSSPLPR